TRSGKVMRRL
nr:Chain B, ACETYL-COENZYME A SYNTHETASE 2-LIKE, MITOCHONDRIAL [Homo sapiens]